MQAPYNLRCAFQPEILDATNQAAALLRSLAKDINNMKRSLHTNLLKRVHSSTERLQRSIDLHSYLLTTSSHEIQAFPPKLPLSQPSKTITSNEQPNLVEADYHHETMRKQQQRRQYSWPSREVDDYEDGGVDTELLQKMRTFESTAALSLATFASLLIEFVARLDHLVDATDLLAKMAKFKDDRES